MIGRQVNEMFRQIHRTIIAKRVYILIGVFVLIFLFISTWNLNASVDEDAEDLNIDRLKDKLMKLKRSHFLNMNKPVSVEDFENGSFEQQHTQNHTLNHKRLFNDTLDLSNFTGENCRNTVQGKLLITDERGW